MCATLVLISAHVGVSAQPITDPQGDVGIGTVAPDPSAILELNSTTKGFLMPRMTEAQRNAIVAPATGLQVYNTDSNTIQYNWGTPTAPAWVTVVTDSNIADIIDDIAWLLGGNAGTTAYDGTTGNFLGTHEKTDMVFVTDSIVAMRIDGTDQHLGIGLDPVNDYQVAIQGDANLQGNGNALRVEERVRLHGTTTPFSMDGDDGTPGELLQSNGVGSTPSWTNDLTVNSIDVDSLQVNDYANIDGPATFNDSVFFNGPIDITSLAVDSLIVSDYAQFDGTTLFTDSVTINGKLTVDTLCVTGPTDFGGVTTFNDSAIFQSDVTNNGNVINNSTSTFNDVATFNSQAVFNDSVTINGKLTVDSLCVTGPANFTGTVQFDSTVSFTDSLLVEGPAMFDSTVVFNDSVIFNGPVSLGDNVNVDSLTVNDYLQVDGSAIFNDSVTINGKLTVDSLCVTGPSDFGGVATFNDSLIANDATVLNSTVSFTNLTEVASADSILVIDGNGNAQWITKESLLADVSNGTFDTLTVNDLLTVDGPAIFNDSVTINGKLTVDSLCVTGPTDFGGVVNFNDTTIFNRPSIFNDTSIFNTNVYFYGDSVVYADTTVVNIGNNVVINNDSTVVNNTFVSNDTSIFNGPTTFGDTVIFNGPVSLGDNVNVDSLTVNDYLQVDGPAIFNDSVTINGKLTVDSLCVTGPSDFGGVATFNDSLIANGVSIFNDSATFNDYTNIQGNEFFTDSTVINNNLVVNDTAVFNNTVIFTGPSSFDTLTVNDLLTVDGVANFNDTTTFNGQTIFNDSVFINGKLTVDSLCVTGPSDFGGVATFNDSLIANDATVLNSTVSFTNLTEVASADSILVIDGNGNAHWITKDSLLASVSGSTFDTLTVNDLLTVDGVSVFNDTATFNEVVNFNDSAYFAGNVQIDGKLYVDSLCVTGPSDFGGNVTFTGDSVLFSDTTYVNIGDNIVVNGDTTLFNQGPVIFSDTTSVTFGGPTTFDTTSVFNDTAVFNGPVVFNEVPDILEWVDGDSISAPGTIYAKQALENGTADTIAITDDGKVGIGTSSPLSGLTLINDATGDASRDDIILISSSATSVPSVGGIRQQGTGAAPSPTLSGDGLLLLAGAGYDGTNYVLPAASIELTAAADFNTSVETRINFSTHDGTSLSERMRIDPDGNVGIGETTPLNRLHVDATTDPLRLDGLANDNTLDSVLVVDGQGVVHWISADSLLVNVSGSTFDTLTVNDLLTIDGIAVFNDSVTINGKLTVDSLCVTGPSDFGGVATFNDSLLADGSAVFSDTTTFDGPTIFNDTATFNDGVVFSTIAQATTADSLLILDGDGNVLWFEADSLYDHDWYEVGTARAPDDITDSVYTMGQVSIGSQLNDATLRVGNGDNQVFGDVVTLDVWNSVKSDSLVDFANPVGFNAFELSNMRFTPTADHNIVIQEATNWFQNGSGTHTQQIQDMKLYVDSGGSTVTQFIQELNDFELRGSSQYQSITGTVNDIDINDGSTRIARGASVNVSLTSPGVIGQGIGFDVTQVEADTIATGVSITNVQSLDSIATGLFISNINGLDNATGLFIDNVNATEAWAIRSQASVPSHIRGNLLVGGSIGDTPANKLHVSNTSDPLRLDGLVNDNTLDSVLVVDGQGVVHWISSDSLMTASAAGWDLEGNGSTTPGTGAGENYLGTSDGQDLVIATNATERMRVGQGTTDSIVLVSGTADAVVGDTQDSTVWDVRVTGDVYASGIYKSGGSLWMDGRNAAQNQVTSDNILWMTTRGANALELHVDETGTSTEGRGRVMRYEPNATSANIIGGHNTNSVGAGTFGAVVAGGGVNGLANSVTGNFGAVSGGVGNTASGGASAIGGGIGNTASNGNTVIGGGQGNSVSGIMSTIGGGRSNNVSGDSATVGGGQGNVASANGVAIGGGIGNTASDYHATVGGGRLNSATDTGATVSGGLASTASNNYATVSGGAANTASGDGSVVSGGGFNTASGSNAVVSGGSTNQAVGNRSAIGGGAGNRAGLRSAIPGGLGLHVGDQSFGFSGHSNVLNTVDFTGQNNVAVFNNVDLWLSNVSGVANRMHFVEPNAGTLTLPDANVHSTTFRAQAQGANINYILPAAAGSANEVLRISAVSGTDVTLDWGAGSAVISDSAWMLTGNAGTTPGTGARQNYIGTSDAQDVVVATNGAERMRVTSGGNVGVGATPGATNRLDVQTTTNAGTAVNISANNAANDGIAINVTEGRMVYSYATVASAGTIPSDVMVVDILTDGNAATAATAVLPTTAVNGQFIIVTTSDPQGATVNGFTFTNTTAVKWIRAAGAWKREF